MTATENNDQRDILSPVVTSKQVVYVSTDTGPTSAAYWRSSALAAPLRQLSAIDADLGSGRISSSPFSTPSKMPRATDSGEAFGLSKPRVISVSTAPARTAWTLTSRAARRARSDCVSENVAASEIE